MIVRIKSKDNQNLKFVRSLGRRKARDSESAFVVEGRIMVFEAIKQAKNPLFLVISDSLADKEEGKQIIKKAAEKSIDIYQIADRLFDGLSKMEEPQGVLLVLKKDEGSWEEIVLRNENFLLILDGLQDPGNLGTIIRTAAAIDVDCIILTKGTVDLYNDKTLRSTMGAFFKVKLMQDATHEEIIHNCSKISLPIVVADAKGAKPYFVWDFTQRMALVIGSESQGPSPTLSSQAKAILSIPMPGQMESLNAGVAAGILMYEKIRQGLSRNNND